MYVFLLKCWNSEEKQLSEENAALCEIEKHTVP